MSLARISRRLAAARQKEVTTEEEDARTEKEAQKIPFISLSTQWQSLSDKSGDPKPLPLEALGSLLFSLSGYEISTTKEYFNVSHLEKCSQVLLIVIENMSTLDLEEKPTALGKFRETVKRNGCSAVVMPALAVDHSTGSELSQVGLNFQKDTAIIRHLISETSGVPKLKSLTGETSKRTSNLGPDIVNIDDLDSDDECLEDTMSENNADPAQRLKDFKLNFPRRHMDKLKERLRKSQSDGLHDHQSKRLKLENGNSPVTIADVRQRITDAQMKVKLERTEKLELLKQEKFEIQCKISKIRDSTQGDKEHDKKAHIELEKLRRDFRGKKHDYDVELTKLESEQSQVRNNDALNDSAEKEQNEDLLSFLNEKKKQSESGLRLTPVGTVIDPGNLNRTNPEIVDRRLLLLSPAEMKAQGFILDNRSSLKTYTPVSSKSRLFGIDCEMCLTTKMANELTRVTVVDEDGVVLVDDLVKPKAKIINYLTQFSGITEEHMQGVTMRKEEVLRKLRRILPSDAILVGHSLDSDLKALGISHPYCIDTSVIYSIKGYRQKSKLKVLMKTFLGEDIQTGGAAGHCSAEDSYSALKLVLLKLQNGITFGDIDLKGNLVWNGIDYEDAMREALRDVLKEKSERGPCRNVWVRKKTQPIRPVATTNGHAESASTSQHVVVKLESARESDFYKQKRLLSKMTAERRRQERAMLEIRNAFKQRAKSSRDIVRQIIQESRKRRVIEQRVRQEKSEIDSLLLAKLREVESQKRELSEVDQSDQNGRSSKQSLVVLLAKERFLEQKLLDLEREMSGTSNGDRKTNHSHKISVKQCRQNLAKIQKYISEKEAEECSKTIISDDDKREEQTTYKDDEDLSSENDDKSENIVADDKIDENCLNESNMLKILEENEGALEQLRCEEEILREELDRAAAKLRRTVIETKVAAKHQHNEILARKVALGLVDLGVIFVDNNLLHRFIDYQLFVLRKNEEFLRKRGKAFGTVALDRLYINMFSAWRSAGKKSVVVADKAVAEMNYDRVETLTPENGLMSSIMKTTRQALRTHDLVVSHLSYDDLNENELSIESAIEYLWRRVKLSAVMIVLIEGTYHYKRLGYGMASILVRDGTK